MVSAPKVKFDGHTAYKDTYKDFKVEKPVHSLGKGCPLDNTDIPHKNFLNSNSHQYYDDKAHKYNWDNDNNNVKTIKKPDRIPVQLNQIIRTQLHQLILPSLPTIPTQHLQQTPFLLPHPYNWIDDPWPKQFFNAGLL